jgi:ubiquinone/menaquinone biosynthesis C-methylase UbiE
MQRTIATYRSRFKRRDLASAYAERFQRGSRRAIDRRERSAVKRIFSSLPDCHTVLDVPSGAGRFAVALGNAKRMVIEMDVAFPILLHAQEETRRQGLPAACVLGDASRLPLRDGAADAVFCNRLLHHILPAEERALILHELRRVARRYAVVSFFDYHAFGKLRYWLKRFKGRRPPYEGQPTMAQFQSEVERCGFRLRSVERIGPPWVAQKYFVLEKVRTPAS